MRWVFLSGLLGMGFVSHAVPLKRAVNVKKNGAVLRCEARALEKDTLGNQVQNSLHEVGAFTVQDCVNQGIALKKKVGPQQKVEIRYIHYTETSGTDVSRGSRGWFLFSKIEDENQAPNQFDYAEFINP